MKLELTHKEQLRTFKGTIVAEGKGLNTVSNYGYQSTKCSFVNVKQMIKMKRMPKFRIEMVVVKTAKEKFAITEKCWPYNGSY